jgi:NADH:ubiquinone oxidoreductase subunit K
MTDSLELYLLVALALFCIGLYGVLQRRNLIAILIAVELMLNAVMINFMAFNRFLAPDPGVGQIFTIFIIAVAAAEAAIGLSIILVLYRSMGSIDVEEADRLKG